MKVAQVHVDIVVPRFRAGKIGADQTHIIDLSHYTTHLSWNDVALS